MKQARKQEAHGCHPMTSARRIRTWWGGHRFCGLLAGALLVLIAGAGRCVAAEPAAADIAKAIGELGAGNYRVRAQASAFLWQAGSAAEPALRQALASDDPEISCRAREILGKFKYGIFPDTPAEVVELIGQFKAGAREMAIKKLIDLRDVGFPAIAAILRIAEYDKFRHEIGFWLGATNAIVLPNLLNSGQHDLAEKMLELEATTDIDYRIRAYAAWLLSRGRLASRIGRLQAEPMPGAFEMRQLVYMHRANGDLTNAIACAIRLADPDLTRNLRIEIGDWQSLAKDPGGENNIERMGFRATFQRLAGNRVEFERSLQDIQAYAQQPLNYKERWCIAEIFLLNDRMQDAMEFLGRAKMRKEVFNLLIAQDRDEEAFRVVDEARAAKDIDLRSMELEQARDQYILGQTNEAQQIVRRVLATELAVADYATMADRLDDDERIQRIISSETGWPPPSPSPDIVAAMSVGMLQEAAEMAAQALNQIPAGQAAEREKILRGLYPDFAARADAWLSLLHAEFPQTSQVEHLVRLHGYFTGRRASLRDYVALADKAATNILKLTSAEQQHLWQSLSDAHSLLGAQDRALACERLACNIAKPTADYMRLVSKLGMAAQWREAAAVAREAYALAPKPEYLWACGWATIKAGDEKAGREDVERANLLALANENSREAMVDLLRTWNVSDEAIRQAEMKLRLGDFDARGNGECVWYLIGRAKMTNDFAKSFRMLEQRRLSLLRTGAYYNDRSHYLYYINACGVAAAHEAIAGGRMVEALQHIRVAQEVDPINSDIAIKFVPLLEKAGQKEGATEVFQRTFQALTDVSLRFPGYVQGHNGVAWLAARTRRELTAGLEHARMAVALDPAAHGVRDTLAEVLFQLGRRDEAIAEMKKCVEQQPDRKYYHQQLKRMQDDDPATEPPLYNDQ